jgi:hypothetical protein
MNLQQFVMTKIAEECTEVGKRALKQAQFGAGQHDEGYPPNARRLHDEVTDLMMWLAVAQKIGISYPAGNVYARFREKQAKIVKVLRISVEQGQVDAGVLAYFDQLVMDVMP